MSMGAPNSSQLQSTGCKKGNDASVHMVVSHSIPHASCVRLEDPEYGSVEMCCSRFSACCFQAFYNSGDLYNARMHEL